MNGLYARRKKRGDLLVKLYVPRDLIEHTEAGMLHPPTGANQKAAWRFAFQELVGNLLFANEYKRTVDVDYELSSNLFLFQLGSDLDSTQPKRRRRGKKRA